MWSFKAQQWKEHFTATSSLYALSTISLLSIKYLFNQEVLANKWLWHILSITLNWRTTLLQRSNKYQETPFMVAMWLFSLKLFGHHDFLMWNLLYLSLFLTSLTWTRGKRSVSTGLELRSVVDRVQVNISLVLILAEDSLSFTSPSLLLCLFHSHSLASHPTPKWIKEQTLINWRDTSLPTGLWCYHVSEKMDRETSGKTILQALPFDLVGACLIGSIAAGKLKHSYFKYSLKKTNTIGT